jgi:FkbM family methyltransferase
MPRFYQNYPRAVYRLRIYFLDFLARHSNTRKMLFFFLKRPRIRRLYTLYTYLQRNLGLYGVLKPADTAIQAGVSTDTPWSQEYDIARLVPKGTLVAIEPDPRNIKILSGRFREFDADVRLVGKATFSRSKNMKLYLGKNKSWTRIPKPWKSYRNVRFRKDQYDVQADTIDNILKELKIPCSKVGYVNITNNGAEFDTLKGMTRLLKESRNICISVIAGARGNTDALIGGRPDEEVIMDFLKAYGFRARFRGFHKPGSGFGYVVAVKGNKPFLM